MRVEPIPHTVRPARRSPGERLRAAVLELAHGHGEVQNHTEKAWASITFAGSRHTIRLVFEGQDQVESGEQLVAELPDHEFAIPRQLVADATITSVESSLVPTPRMVVECELLMLEDA